MNYPKPCFLKFFIIQIIWSTHIYCFRWCKKCKLTFMIKVSKKEIEKTFTNCNFIPRVHFLYIKGTVQRDF
jgi:hypothetical protein